MIKKELGEMKAESLKKVVEYFSTIATRGTAKDIGVSGSFMSSLCQRGYMSVVDTQESFMCINENENLYRKVEVNIYAPRVKISTLCERYANSINRIANTEKVKALSMIETAKDRLTAVQSIISRIDYVNPSH